MLKKIVVRKNAYFDSVTLMSLGSKVKKLEGVSQAVVVMATEMNREILMNVGLGNEETENAGPNDLVLAVEAEGEEALLAAFGEIEEKLAGNQDKKKNRDSVYKTQEEALKDGVKANLAVISVPGRFAAREAKKALKNNMHVMLFSDNVTVEQERELKELAREKGLCATRQCAWEVDDRSLTKNNTEDTLNSDFLLKVHRYSVGQVFYEMIRA